jgi:hypothetical protein
VDKKNMTRDLEEFLYLSPHVRQVGTQLLKGQSQWNIVRDLQMQCGIDNPKGHPPRISIVTSESFGNVPVEHLFSEFDRYLAVFHSFGVCFNGC